MKPLNRPMFKMGGPVKEGIMDGIREPKADGGTIGGGVIQGRPAGQGRTGFNVINLLKQNKLKNNEVKFFIGYSGWGKNQLADEINENSWLISSKFLKKNIFNTSTTFWKKKINEFGEFYKIWSNSPDNPSLN